MNIRTVAITVLILYVLISPLLIYQSENRGYTKGYAIGYSDSTSISPLHHYKVGDRVENTHDYWRYFNNSAFGGSIKKIDRNGVLTIGLDYWTIDNQTNNLFIINEYWTQPVTSVRK